jgi:hypothetical protein
MGVPDDLMLTTAQLRALNDLASRSALTVTHPILALAGPATPSGIVDSKRALEAMLQSEVSLFAYPNGMPGRDYGAEHASMARRAGFRAAVSTAKGVATKRSDRFQLPRFTPWGRAPMFGLRLAQHLASRDAPPARAEALAR